MNPIDPIYKDTVYKKLNSILLDSFEKGLILEDEMSTIAQYILTHGESCVNREEFVLLLGELKDRWPFFSDVYTLFASVDTASEDAQKISQLQTRLHQFITK